MYQYTYDYTQCSSCKWYRQIIINKWKTLHKKLCWYATPCFLFSSMYQLTVKTIQQIHLTLNSLGSRVWYTQNNFVRTLLISSLVLGLNSSSLHHRSLCLSFQASSASWRWASRNFKSSPMRFTWWSADYFNNQVRTWYFSFYTQIFLEIFYLKF